MDWIAWTDGYMDGVLEAALEYFRMYVYIGRISSRCIMRNPGIG